MSKFFGKIFAILALALVLAGFASARTSGRASAHSNVSTDVKASNYTVCAEYTAARFMWWAYNAPNVKAITTLCFNGNSVWQNSGVNCSVQQFTGSVDTTWCGVWNSGQSYLDVGINFTEHMWWGGNFPCYFRYRVNNVGSITSVWGGC